MNASDFSLSALFGTGLGQHARLITLTTPQESELPESLAAERITGREAINELFCFEVDALSTSADLDLALFLGEELRLGLLQPDGSRRFWHGLCTGAAWMGADGGVARYRLRLEPALALLGLRRDSYIFQDKNARDIVTELLADYPQVRFDFDITQALPVRPICTQYRESDLDFFTRLLALEGLSWRFEHAQEEDQGGHRLVVFDSAAQAPATPGGAALRFHGVRATEEDDAIDGFGARRSVAANAVASSSWHPAQLLAPAAEQQSMLDAGELPGMQVHDGSGERRFADRGAADAHSRLMLQALERDNKVFSGAGAVRRLAAGHGFALTQHERYPEGENVFTVLWVEHEARNNFETGIAGGERGVEKGSYRNRFACVRDTVAIVPAATAALRRTTALGAQAALVVGLTDAVSTTTRDHQVRIQFAWQRGASPNSGGMAHDTDDAGCAPGNETSGTWVRVAEALAGPNWGTLFTPRVGTEVLVDFVEGDIDRPLIVAQLHNGVDTPPFPAGVESGADHAGTLSGIHSRNFDGSGFNQWQLDDTAGQVRTRLATSTAATQLNLGYLIQQAPGSSTRGAYRGSGFELRTDAWGVVRGGEGVLLSTSARACQGCGVPSTQMDTLEAVSMLKGAQALGKTLFDAATQQGALSSKDAEKAQRAFIEQIDPKAKGKYAGAVGGQQALKSRAGSRELDGAGPVEKFGSALVLMDSAAGINWATPASTVLYAGQQLAWTTQSDLHLSAAHTVSSVAGSAASLFTHAGGIQAIAANGPVSLQAHTDGLEILADKEITVISVNDCIEIKAKEKIVLQAGQSAITLEGGDITFACPGKFSVKGGKHLFDQGAKQSAEFPHFPEAGAKLNNFIALNYRDASGEPMAGVGYKIKFAEGVVISGTLDQAGNARHDNVPEKPISAEYEERTPLPDPPWDPLTAMLSRADKMFAG
ncbi:type VI secretion system Vgr family protein [Massilia sp. Se16.2.3]|uniref:type VI secretion system Vgr family protein n=1 Tax=Massilia sp. Se16.2.3 TaxID=2709303 RepID=UPI001603B680|nr:type VI secretion system Vgr family protein [Massilia sp. Se16.2.3]QNA99212.1 type VI secretion system tip protein VgrG [Massilia sp. Se16.2.3]